MAISTMMQKLSLAIAGAASIALGAAGTAQAGTLIDTTPSWDKSIGGLPFSSERFLFPSTVGQTFTVGSDNVLNDFTFWVDDQINQVNFAGYVAEWDGEKVTGPILYTSEKQSTTNAPDFEQFTFNTGGLSLESGKQYVAFLSGSNIFDEIFDYGHIGTTTNQNDTYSGGRLVSMWDLSQISQYSWGYVENLDAAFKASFSQSVPQSVPEPGSVISLLVLGAMGAGSMLKRKQQQKATVKA